VTELARSMPTAMNAPLELVVGESFFVAQAAAALWRSVGAPTGAEEMGKMRAPLVKLLQAVGSPTVEEQTLIVSHRLSSSLILSALNLSLCATGQGPRVCIVSQRW